mmetsp:Transcript_32614/g.72040  ORF Transcript_32614/g.72040 Transcript_32614/m.72040 type:complete len:1058 (+) Transcript_32614:132-3305(+)|eukprot:CAMPEP_0202890400 /NCGR_PEP_ID=MMETSP1392-20130828/814_1 /ASSEMBLY_ACC=CAM_ASM_000868 /TAXON_ID=225041 /ORGANISM="Chlamydomonas chlamydogama, Strain SAG 11-48b" /LENGTH=1057 /DNA_ID=CAMNT_0049573957 /DNA_START=113 /DNA_END=3286 /DNA_ORIENTATION=-
MSKIVAKLQNAKAMLKSGVASLGPDREFENLIRAIGEAKSKQEEDRILTVEVETLKQRLSDPKLDRTRGREYMVRLIYCEMLGHDASFAYVKALQFASEPNIHTKKAAYLALTQFLDYNNELVLLLVNTLLSDLKSDNFIAVCTALVVTTKLIGPELINAVYPMVVERLRHPKEHVRKKAIMVLHRFHQFDPRREGPLAGVDMDRHFRTMLCDKDPSVMSAALCALHEVIKVDPKPYKNLIPSFTSIMKQVSEHRLPKSYDYHRFPAPFIQIKLLKILAALGVGDRASSENMYAVIQQTLRRANSSHTIGNALIYECVRTITTIYPNPQLLAAAAESISTFLRSTSHNLRYVGIDALAGIVQINPQYAQEHQLAVIDCLEDPDDTLKLKTLELLYKMTKANNVEVIVEKMMMYLRSTSDDHIKRDIVRKVSELAERYAPSPSWFITVVSEVFELGGEHVEPQLAHSLMRLIAEQDEDLHRSAVDVYLKLLDKPKLPGILLQVICWVLGEYGSLATRAPQRPLSPQAVMGKLLGVLSSQKPSDAIKASIITALTKICAQTGCRLTPEAEDLVHKASSSQSVELQQRAYELQSLLTSPPSLQQSVLPADASCEDFEAAELEQLKHLGFLDWYVQEALRNGAAPYIPEEQRASARASTNGDKGGLRFEAYETAPAPIAPPSSHARNYSGSAAAPDMFDFASSSASAGPAPGRPAHGRSPSGGAAVPASSEPHLRGAAGRSRWGPAQYEGHGTPAAPAAGGAAAPKLGSGSASAGDLYGSSAGGASAGGSSKPAKPVPQQSERDKLAASIFGGGASSGAGAAAASTPPKAPPPSAASSHVHQDLLDLSTPSPPQQQQRPAAAPPATPPPAKSNLDMLFDLDVIPTQPASQPVLAQPLQQQAPAPLGGLGGLDLLGGGFAAGPAVQAVPPAYGALPLGGPGGMRPPGMAGPGGLHGASGTPHGAPGANMGLGLGMGMGMGMGVPGQGGMGVPMAGTSGMGMGMPQVGAAGGYPQIPSAAQGPGLGMPMAPMGGSMMMGQPMGQQAAKPPPKTAVDDPFKDLL